MASFSENNALSLAILNFHAVAELLRASKIKFLRERHVVVDQRPSKIRHFVVDSLSVLSPTENHVQTRVIVNVTSRSGTFQQKAMSVDREERRPYGDH